MLDFRMAAVEKKEIITWSPQHDVATTVLHHRYWVKAKTQVVFFSTKNCLVNRSKSKNVLPSELGDFVHMSMLL